MKPALSFCPLKWRTVSPWAIVALLATTNAVADFPMAGGNAQRTGFVDVEGPASAPSILWERPLDVAGISDTQPVIDGDDNVYATASPINAKRWSGPEDPKVVLVSFTPDGEERWRYVHEWPHTQPGYGGTWSQLSGPVISKDTVVIGHRFGVVRGLDRNQGTFRWERDLSAGTQPITSTPVVDGAGFVYMHCRDIPTINKIDASSGEIEWVHRFVDEEIGNTSSPTLSPDEKTLYIGRTVNSVAYLYAVNTTEGTFKWAWSPERAKGHSFAWSVPILSPNGTIHVQDEELAHLYAVRDSGRVHVFQWAVYRKGRGAPRLGAADTGGYYGQYTTASGAHPVVFSTDTEGKERWESTLVEGETGGMLVTRSALYFGMNGTGKVHALDKGTGQTLWSKQVGTKAGGFSEGLTLGENGTLYVGVDGTARHPKMACLVALR